MNKSIERQINQIYAEVFKKVFNEKNCKSMISGSKISTEAAIIKLENSKEYDRFAKKFSEELAKKGLAKQRGVWRKYYEAAKKLRTISIPSTYQEYELKIMANAVRHNFTMIKSIPSKMIEVLNHKYTSTLIEEVIKGKLPRGSFQKMLAKHGHKQAKVIARTETAKLQTVIMEDRSTSLGSICYKWRSSNDKRTRPSHKAMNGVIVFWGSGFPKPVLDGMTGNFGEFPNCRCDGEPIFDERDLNQSNYKVWDYRSNKIITMSKTHLIRCIKNRGLD